jgi:hypothetical protein
LILLGASNLTRGLPIVFNTSRALLGDSIDVIAALGHGRSYGIASRIFGRTLPSILECGLWDALSRAKLPGTPLMGTRNSEPGSRLALITDIGNDIMYGAQPEQIRDWLATCVIRLLQHRARIVLTAMPTQSLARLGPRRYRLLQSLMFPGRDLRFEVVMERVERLDRLVRELAHRFDLRLVEPRREWFGFDAIHIRRRRSAAVWRQLLAPWRPDRPAGHLAQPSLLRFMQLRCCLPARSRWFGVELQRPQPRRILADGTTVSLY